MNDIKIEDDSKKWKPTKSTLHRWNYDGLNTHTQARIHLFCHFQLKFLISICIANNIHSHINRILSNHFWICNVHAFVFRAVVRLYSLFAVQSRAKMGMLRVESFSAKINLHRKLSALVFSVFVLRLYCRYGVQFSFFVVVVVVLFHVFNEIKFNTLYKYT